MGLLVDRLAAELAKAANKHKLAPKDRRMERKRWFLLQNNRCVLL